MTTPPKSTSEDVRIFNELWLIGGATALVFAIPATYWRTEAPWIMALGVLVAIGLAVLVEVTRSRKPDFLLTLSPGQKSWRFYRRLVSVFIRTTKPAAPIEQLELAGLERIWEKPANRVIVLKDDQQRTMTLVELERFMARVTSVIGEDLGKASEYSLSTAWARLKPLKEEYPQMEAFFRDPLVIETLRRDMAANAHVAIAKAGEQAARFFLEEFSKSQDVCRYRIVDETRPAQVRRPRAPAKKV